MPSIADIKSIYVFKSDSSGATYQTLVYADGSISCDCPGWTKRCVNGVRTCKHARLVQAGLGHLHSLNGSKVTTVQTQTTTKQIETVPARRFDFED